MIDGIHFRDRVILLALGIDAQGNKHVLGLREGSTEATRVVASLLSDLVERGLDAQRMRLWVIDGGKALRRAVVQTFGPCALVQRCQEHKRRNVLEHLPEDMHASVKRALKDAWSASDAELGRKQLGRLASSLQARHPGAAASLREGLEETLHSKGIKVYVLTPGGTVNADLNRLAADTGGRVLNAGTGSSAIVCSFRAIFNGTSSSACVAPAPAPERTPYAQRGVNTKSQR